ncbi:CBS domain-containing protein [Marinomonas polaris]|uniref:CBS domain-containing protein n=1 Tax=Marinomonas polaris DSM 16579 TaxID=1122206 RepID=A0A1M4ZKH6_9GAMM|nr:CBS domain-containing protein [Marinomonas polaris]SHF18465.1 CBS domain-containing protein [Marinomonas polaris DSM 16579]|tara:strand:- start:13704 stop:14297 length:594 start_codon:yes stop_codon:yes gene_type:complete
MKTLTYVSTKDVNELTWPATTENINLYSSALSVFTDFQTAGPRVIESNTRADELVQLMRKEHVRMKIVVDADNRFVGVISLEDLSEDVFIKQVANGFQRSELMVADLMRAKEVLLALSYTSLKHSDIESLLFSQRNNKLQHLLVIDEDTKMIRGLISSNDVARQLRLDIDVSFSSFAQTYQSAILGQKEQSKKLKVA